MPNDDSPIRLLLVDDERMSCDMLVGMIGDEPGVTVHYESDPARLIGAAHAFQPGVLLVDLRMPGIDGLGVIRLLRADPVTAGIPILMLSSEDDPHVKAAGFAAGAVDYLVKWPARVELMARVRAHARSHRLATELVRRSEELAQAQAALHEAQQAEAIGKLTGGVASDINNILHLINGHLELMRVEHDGDARALRRIGAASEGVRRGTRLAEELLAMARPRRHPAAPLDVAAFLHDFAARRDDVTPLLPPHGGHAAALDPVALEKILTELVDNARAAMAHAAPVIIELDSEDRVDRGAALPPGQYVRISIIDTGGGMAPAVLQRAFEPFFSTRHGVTGAGLGLPVAAGLVRKHGGRIDIDSVVGQGTRVTLRFPREAAGAPDR